MMKPEGILTSKNLIYLGLIQTSYRDYLTGFRKRNLLKKEASKKRREEREKLERQELRRDVSFHLERCSIQTLSQLDVVEPKNAGGTGCPECDGGGAGLWPRGW
jgi:hypothetical protein